MTQQIITAQIEFESAMSQYIETTVWHSTYAMSSQHTQQYYKIYKSISTTADFDYPSFDELVFQWQLDQLD
ncbi:201_t:CDS:1, partial [Funneliformis caledonium]